MASTVMLLILTGMVRLIAVDVFIDETSFISLTFLLSPLARPGLPTLEIE